jgi:membrane-associated phospholipid phosphatase
MRRSGFGAGRLAGFWSGTLVLSLLCALAPAARAEVRWSDSWPRFRWWEFVGTAALGLGAGALQFYSKPPDTPRRQGGILIDEAFRGWVRAESPDGRQRARKLSDLLWLGGTAVPFLVDLPVVLVGHRQPGLAGQLLLMDLEAYSVTGLVNLALEVGVGRGRPPTADCARAPDADDLCGAPGNNASFPSGHTLGLATAAGLTCIHHRYLPLYGHPVADAGACAMMSLATVVTGAARIIGDRHYLSDVLAGAALGFGVGYGLPWLLHYRYGARAPERNVALAPLASPGTLGASLVGGL